MCGNHERFKEWHRSDIQLPRRSATRRLLCSEPSAAPGSPLVGQFAIAHMPRRVTRLRLDPCGSVNLGKQYHNPAECTQIRPTLAQGLYGPHHSGGKSPSTGMMMSPASLLRSPIRAGPGSVLTTRTAPAPAACARRAFSMKVQPPRRTTATLPRSCAAFVSSARQAPAPPAQPPSAARRRPAARKQPARRPRACHRW